MTIVKDTAGKLYSIKDYPGINHAWLGIPVKKLAPGYVALKGKARLIRKAGCIVVFQD